TFDLAVAPESFGLLAHIEHRQSEPVGHPGGERNAGGLATRDRIELLEPGLAHDGGGGEVDQRRAHARKRDQPAAVGVDRACPAGCKAARPLPQEPPRGHPEQLLALVVGPPFLVGKADAGGYVLISPAPRAPSPPRLGALKKGDFFTPPPPPPRSFPRR